MQALIRDLNAIYTKQPALHAEDSLAESFRWIIMDDSEQSVFAYLRLGRPGDKPLLVVCNFTPVPRYEYRVGVPEAGRWTELLNTDSSSYGGTNAGNTGGAEALPFAVGGMPASLILTLPPLATLVLTAS